MLSEWSDIFGPKLVFLFIKMQKVIVLPEQRLHYAGVHRVLKESKVQLVIRLLRTFPGGSVQALLVQLLLNFLLDLSISKFSTLG
jgi:hypothetical protein